MTTHRNIGEQIYQPVLHYKKTFISWSNRFEINKERRGKLQKVILVTGRKFHLSLLLSLTPSSICHFTHVQVTESLEHNGKHDQDYTEIQEASYKLSIPLVSGVAVGAVAVFLVSLFNGLAYLPEKKQ